MTGRVHFQTLDLVTSFGRTSFLAERNPWGMKSAQYDIDHESRLNQTSFT